MPIVYLHGLGFGLLQSYLLIKSLLTKLDTHPILIPLAPHTAQSVFHPRHLRPWTQDEVVSGMTTICKRWGFWVGDKSGGVSRMSHSNGSVAHAWCESDVWLCGCVVVWLCGCVVVWLCGCVGGG
jgi:hypothetical protein